jgi:glucose 1-dehydrogenase
MFNLKDKKALVTGSTQGIGFAIAKILSEHGAKVFINGASGIEKCIAASKKIANSIPVLADLSDMAEIDRLYTQTGDVDILVINASAQYKSAWDETEIKNMDAMLCLNVKSPLKLIQKYSVSMKEKRFGRILTIGTVNQHKTHKTLAGYAATKCAQMSLVKNIAKELAPFGVTVNNLSPGAIYTPRNAQDFSNDNFKKDIISSIPCGRIGTANDCAVPALFLCSEEASYITGADIIVDGGLSL